jgi:hypothetical protein
MISVVQLYDHDVSREIKIKNLLLQFTEVCVSTYWPGSCFLFTAARTSPVASSGTWNVEMWPWQILLCRWATTPPRKQKAWWWKQFLEGTIGSLCTSSDQAISRFLIYVYFCLLLVRESGRSYWSSHHRNPAESELSNLLFLLLWRLRRQRHWWDDATATPVPQVAGESEGSLRIVLWLVFSAIE